jgi:hypothetical protein
MLGKQTIFRHQPMGSRVRIALVLLLCSMTLCLIGCASAPVQEMSNARQAIAAADDAGASATAGTLMSEARALMTSAEDKLQRHNYLGARMDATNARLKAVQALEQTQKKQ